MVQISCIKIAHFQKVHQISQPMVQTWKHFNNCKITNTSRFYDVRFASVNSQHYQIFQNVCSHVAHHDMHITDLWMYMYCVHNHPYSDTAVAMTDTFPLTLHLMNYSLDHNIPHSNSLSEGSEEWGKIALWWIMPWLQYVGIRWLLSFRMWEHALGKRETGNMLEKKDQSDPFILCPLNYTLSSHFPLCCFRRNC
jgi:hypothetical protein